MSRAYMTLLSKQSYLPGTVVLYHSLQLTRPKYPFIVLVTSTLPIGVRQFLERSGIQTIEVTLLSLDPSRYDPSQTDARFADTWTKLRVFELDEYEKVVFLDSDTLVRKNMDDIFDLPISANQVAGTYACACNITNIPHYPKDWIPANCGYSQPNYPANLNRLDDSGTPEPRPYHLLNSGMFLCRPSRDLMSRIKKMLDTSPLVPDWKFPDQDLISTFFGGGGEDPRNWGDVTEEEIGDQWMRIPYYYNGLRTLRKIHSSIWNDDEIRMVHYVLMDKPWRENRPSSEHEVVELWWWDVYTDMIQVMTSDGRGEDIKYLEDLVGPKTKKET